MLGEIEIHLNSEPVKYAVILLSIPFWWPFAKALWEELNGSLADEGGLLGEEPDAEELARLHANVMRDTPMVSDPWDTPSRGSSRVANAARELQVNLDRTRRGGFRER
jgi:hypothetical protein